MLFILIGVLLGLSLMLSKRVREILGLFFSLGLGVLISLLIGATLGLIAPKQPVHETQRLSPHYTSDGPLLVTYQGTSWYVVKGKEGTIQREDVHPDPSSKGILVVDGDSCENGFWSLSLWSLCDDDKEKDIYVPEGTEYILE